MKLSCREIMERLSIREWSVLCALIDTFGPTQMMAYKHGSGSDLQVVSGRLRATKFDVIKIVGEGADRRVFVDLGKGKLAWYWLNANAAVNTDSSGNTGTTAALDASANTGGV